ncbi:FxSxx-COOH system tetratricopeptide repeat protein [Streptomyces sp. NBC_00140]|uniref:FxSxx-COOH system tetratricopeptide repeat protein n=1 Tax=Streptomyces sp. NBC_00140 TaxID=2975664 RepID=UPI00225807C1|nr:FxSxx-COOH system tetratricopeptide repeat protein [Streptomyces sp. NBC_00140]MCX5332705.1 FxSxx-COOH system tetratricopeptide repeat protein [Streptomyces sp. NBC_00140]
MNKLDGKVVTFYSYKGGVGRSFLLSNTATLLAQWGYRVLCIDWDLEAPGLHYYFRPHMASPETGLVEMVLGARDGRSVDALGHITPVNFPDGSRLDLIAAGGVGGDYVPNVQGINWDALYEERDFGNVLEDWRRRWIESYDVIFVDSRTGISDSGGICTAQLPHILAYAFTANQQNVDGVLEVVARAAKARNGLPYDRSRLLTLPLLCRFDMSEEYERAADWRRKLQPDLKPSYNAWVPEGAAVERVLDHCTVPYSAYWSFGEELPVLTEDFRNPQLISYSLASVAGLIARNLSDVRLFTESRDSYVDAAIRTGRRGGQYQYDFFISGAANTSDDANKLAALLAAEGFTSSRGQSRDDDPLTFIDTCRHLILLARDTVESQQRVEVNYFLRQTLDEQSDRALFPVITPRHVLRDLPSIAQSIPPYALSEDGLPSVARAISARMRGDTPPTAAPENSYASPDEHVYISHAGPDRAWAEWVAWQLQDAGYTVELDVWHWGAGDNFVERVDQSVRRGRTIALFSEAYFHPDRYTMAEASEVLAAGGKLIPVRIEHAVAPPALRALLAPSLVGLDEEEARAVLLQAVAGPLGTPISRPGFPGADGSRRSSASGPRLPGSLPKVWNLQPRRANFVGREDLLMEVRTGLTESRTAPALALSGRIGVGKTQLAIEYAHRFSGEYELVWWVEADLSILPQLAALAWLIECADAGVSEQEAVRALLNHLRTRPRWLIVFDNAEEPADLTQHLPTGEGHVLITSRNPLWHQVASPVEVDVLSHTESVDLLRARSPRLSEKDAGRLATALDGLPLALAQAGESLYLFTADQYLRQLEEHADAAVGDGSPLDYPGSLSSQLDESMIRLHSEDALALDLLRACALLAPEPFPLHACDPVRAPGDDADGEALVQLLSSPRVFRHTLTAMERLGLARGSGGSIQVDRLTQAVLRDQLTSEVRAEAARHASALLAIAYPGQASDPETWPHWPALLPHLLAISPADLTTPLARYAACEACWYLLDRGDARAALTRLRELFRDWEQRFGGDSEDSLWAAAYLARAYADTNKLAEAREVENSTLRLNQPRLGPNHPGTLRTFGNLSLRMAALGDTEEAHSLALETLERQRRQLGEDHPDTLVTAGNLAILLAELGRLEEALTLTEDTLARQRRVLGENHPHTLVTAGNLAIHLNARAEPARARDLALDTLSRQLNLLGKTHPDTLHTMNTVNGRPNSARAVQQPNTAYPEPPTPFPLPTDLQRE